MFEERHVEGIRKTYKKKKTDILSGGAKIWP